MQGKWRQSHLYIYLYIIIHNSFIEISYITGNSGNGVSGSDSVRGDISRR